VCRKLPQHFAKVSYEIAGTRQTGVVFEHGQAHLLSEQATLVLANLRQGCNNVSRITGKYQHFTATEYLAKTAPTVADNRRLAGGGFK
jgi:hypothetical protein